MLKWTGKLLSAWELKVAAPTEFKEAPAEIASRLSTQDADRAREILDEARDLYATVEARAEGAERRATTLQGAVSVAATLAVAGATLLVDPSKVEGAGWRVILAVLFLGLIFCLVATAYRAVQASSQVHKWHSPNAEDVFTRIGQQSPQGEISLAADLLYSYGRNTKIADWKVAYMRAASEWFARALILVLALAVAIAGYVVLGPNQPANNPGADEIARPIQPTH
jgi:hypothetical protein